jgi:holo-[acyl-carrier protein] synthase
VILGLGVDLCPVDRIERILDRHGALFIERVFTEVEQAYAAKFKKQGERLAARFAAKEATIKALGAPEGMKWRDMAVANDASGAPALHLEGRAKARADEMGVSRALVSLSHAGNMAVAVVILEGE